MVHYQVTEEESDIILSFIENLKTEFKGVNKNYKNEKIKGRFLSIEYIINSDKTIDNNNINFFTADDKYMTNPIDMGYSFKQKAIDKIISETTIIK
jgi:hypothetical protein